MVHDQKKGSIITYCEPNKRQIFQASGIRVFSSAVPVQKSSVHQLLLIEKPRENSEEQIKYRPIRLLNVISKIFENLINNRVLNE